VPKTATWDSHRLTIHGGEVADYLSRGCARYRLSVYLAA
jgi:hypothetical protein